MKQLVLILFFLAPYFISAQESSFDDSNVLWYKETYGGIVIHSTSWGVNLRLGKHKTGLRKRFFEFEFTGIKNPKEVRYDTYYEDAKSFIYGKMNRFFVFRPGFGYQHIVTHKPFWGGVELRMIGFIGPSLGFAKPQFLEIYYSTFPTHSEQYNPQKHNLHNIWGRSNFFKGIKETKLHPGIYTKLGLNFEYGVADNSVNALEVGLTFDLYKEKIMLMAYEYNTNYFLSLYFSFNLGMRYN